MNWTSAQHDSIYSPLNNILVSAAAGSGKTAVLVERVINRIVYQGIDADRLLVVTFTKKAATSLKQKVMLALESRLNEESDSDKRRLLIRQKALLAVAPICTIDSFCSTLVSENYEKLAISPDFDVNDEKSFEVYSDEILKDTFEEYFKKAEPDFIAFADYFSSAKSNENLYSTIRKIYEKACSSPSITGYIEQLGVSHYSSAMDSPFAEPFLVYAKLVLDYVVSFSNNVLQLCQQSGDWAVKITEKVDDDVSRFAVFQKYLAGNCFDLDTLQQKYIDCDSFPNFPPIRTKDEEIKAKANKLKDLRNYYKELFRKLLKDFFVSNEEEFRFDCDALKPVKTSIVSLLSDYHKKLTAFKRTRNVYTFNDILHLSLALLQNENGSPTSLALSLREYYHEIYIDEYQDTNSAQDKLFSLISKGNIFRVGDVKQSIYGFRQARPDIFIDYKSRYDLYSSDNSSRKESDDGYKIILSNNFRSRRNICAFTNYVFSSVMSVPFGGVDYNDEEMLISSAEYPEGDETIEYYIKSELDTPEPEYIAQIVKEKLRTASVTQNGVLRSARPSDIAVLLRSKDKMPAVASALEKLGVDSVLNGESEFFSSYEITLVLNLLRVIDNPANDIPLLATMLSVLFDFNADDIAQMKLNSPAAPSLYSALLSVEETDEKYSLFIRKLSKWRRLSVCTGTGDLIKTVCDEVNLEPLLASLPNGKTALKNLTLLLKYADNYETLGYIGVSGFLRYIERMKQKKLDLPGITPGSGTDCVNIMTIHASKGLEFPIVILADTTKKYNEVTETPNISVTDYGLALNGRAERVGAVWRYPTFEYKIAGYIEKKQSREEELRVLYVAMTRAKEKLIIVSDFYGRKNRGNLPIIFGTDPISPVVCSNFSAYSTVLTSALIRHPKVRPIRFLFEMDVDETIDDNGFNLEVHLDKTFDFEQSADFEEVLPDAPAENIMQEIKGRIDYKYPYAGLLPLLSKLSASDIKLEDKDGKVITVVNDYFARKKPAFLHNEFTASQKGTITHSFMQYADFSAAATDASMELNRLVENRIFTQKEADAIDLSTVDAFFRSELYRRMKKSPLLEREKSFTVRINVSELSEKYSDYPEEKITIQGIADAVFLEDNELVIVDYKTDRTGNEEKLKADYSDQLRIYRYALEQCTPYKVKEMYIYSFALKKSIKID